MIGAATGPTLIDLAKSLDCLADAESDAVLGERLRAAAIAARSVAASRGVTHVPNPIRAEERAVFVKGWHSVKEYPCGCTDYAGRRCEAHAGPE